MTPNPQHPAYVQGYTDGYEEGIENNPYDGWGSTAPDHLQYKWGYDRGVSQYCTDFLDGENVDE